MNKYWLTPPKVYEALDNEFHFDFDPCPCPLPENYNGLAVPWGKTNYVNPPFRKKDGPHGGPTAFVRKAIEEQRSGNTSVLLIPVQSYVNLLLEAGAELRSAGRIKWLEADTKEPMKGPSPILCAVLRGNQRREQTMRNGYDLRKWQSWKNIWQDLKGGHFYWKYIIEDTLN